MRLKQSALKLLVWLLYACATLQFIRYYVVATTFYLDMPRYLSGRERLPFQERVLPILLMWPLNHSAILMRHVAHPKGGFDAPSAATAESIAFYILSLVSFSIAGFLTCRLYRAVTQSGVLSGLVFPVFMMLSTWSYVIHIDGDFSYPYDMPSLAFFAGGLLAIYTRHYIPLLLIVLIGTANRETTLFLVILYVIDAASRDLSRRAAENGPIPFRTRFSFAQVSWWRVALLAVAWSVVRLVIHHHFAGNDNSENHSRLAENISRLQPRLWPILLNICGYVLPVILLLQSRLWPLRFRNYLFVLPFWFGVMCYTGVILETRIYGELCSFSAVAAVLLLEEHVAHRSLNKSPREMVSIEQEAEALA